MTTRAELAWYFVLAFAISWALWLPRVATVQGWWSFDVAPWWHYTGAAGPAFAALIVTARGGGTRGVRKLLLRYRPPAHVGWLAFAVAMPLAGLAAGLLLARILDGAWPSFAGLSRTDDLPALGLPFVFAIHTLTFGIGEETGWRGFALPRLQSLYPAMRATHVLAILWGTWHIPSFFENPGLMDLGPFEVAGWCAGLWMGAIFLTWLFNSSGGSLLVVVAWHGLFNQFSASEAPVIVPAVLTLSVIATAIFAIRKAGPEHLRGLSDRSGPRIQEPPTHLGD